MTKDNQEIYLEERKLLLEGQQISYQQFDKYVLTLSTGFLSISVAFLKDVIPQTIMIHKEILVASWILFSASILTTLLSFLVSQQAYKRQLQITEDYYINREQKALEAKNYWAKITTFLNLLSALFFVVAIIATVYFVSINFIKK
ncbi:MAG: hypothetical protein Q8K98_06275 [Bacteroidota bacterium]|nr:hypothetical protein [Bacteroidota bacterium]